MKGNGPPIVIGPGAERKKRVAGGHSLPRSEAGRATSPSPPVPTERTTAPPARPRDLRSSRWLSRRCRTVPVARHLGADHDAISGPLSVWCKWRVRKDRDASRFVRWQLFPSRGKRGEEREIVAGGTRGSRHAVGAPSKLPGALATVAGATDEESASHEAVP